ncbi:unnamed protein product [Notodromas monacha]|uniref:FXNA-like protease n=1 Tax=Notodromas monacha TaxID=399045 RepID=A0A7R9G8R5_9CRUS|nr:unnamed protein product [Notodromas monacha]CAG0913550.1 unnamed protein product [Notodromas monacha]
MFHEVRQRTRTSKDRHRVDDGSADQDDRTRRTLIRLAGKEEEQLLSGPAALACVLFYVGMLVLCLVQDARLPDARTIADAATTTSPNSMPEFVEERARMVLKELTSLGPRPTGSYENEVLAVEVVKQHVALVNRTLDPRVHRLEMDVQVVSGSFSLEMLGSWFASEYKHVQNVVVRLSPATIMSPDGDGGNDAKKHSNDKNALLLNCHLDSVPFSPGASDDAASCAVMLQVLDAVTRQAIPLLRPIVFLWNGAEENLLQASHGFITQHPWARGLAAFVNLEACGAGGREVVFQAGPDCPWLVEAYSKSVPYPAGSIVGQDVFDSGLVPGDTDFRIFRDFGGLSGLDMAFIVNGYVYHTPRDTEDRIPPGSLQRAGDNVLALVRHLTMTNSDGDSNGNNSVNRDSEEQQRRQESGGKVIFFDLLGIVMITYRTKFTGAVLVGLALATTAVCTWLRHRPRSRAGVRARITAAAMAFCVLPVSWLCALAANACVAALTHWCGKTMSYYGHMGWVFPLFLPVPLAVVSLVQAKLMQLAMQMLSLHRHDNNGRGKQQPLLNRQKDGACGSMFTRQEVDEEEEKLYNKEEGLEEWGSWPMRTGGIAVLVFDALVDATRLWLVLALGLLSLTGRGSVFLPTLALLLPAVGELLAMGLRLRKFHWTWLCVYLSSQTVHLLALMTIAMQGAQVFVPVTGRTGGGVNADLALGCLNGICFLLITLFLMPLLQVMGSQQRRRLQWACVAVTGLVVVALMATNVGFPYRASEDSPRLQRFLVAHTWRRFHGPDGRVLREDAGMWVTHLDAHAGTTLARHLLELPHPLNGAADAAAESEHRQGDNDDVQHFGLDDCEERMWCHAPVYYPAVRLLSAASWVPAPKPAVVRSTPVLVWSASQVERNVYNVSLRIQGPDHMTLIVSPNFGWQMDSWSLAGPVHDSQLAYSGRRTYFLYFSYGLQPDLWTPWFLLKKDASDPGATKGDVDELLELGLTGHSIHGNDAQDDYLSAFLARFPAWTYPAGWTCTYDNYRISRSNS